MSQLNNGYLRGLWHLAKQTFFYVPAVTIPGFYLAYAIVNQDDSLTLFPLQVASIYSYAFALSFWVLYAIVNGLALLVKTNGLQRRLNRPNFWLHIPVFIVGLLNGWVLSQYGLYWLLDVQSEKGMFQPDFNMIISATVGLALFFYFAFIEAKARLAQQDLVTKEIQYQTLKDQMQPHFLFNTLNGISELLYQDHDEAAEMLAQLADFYRYILRLSQHKTNTISEEFKLAKSYLDLQRLRFGDRLSYKFVCELDKDKIYVPSFMLQTLLENSIKFGLSNHSCKIVIETSLIGQENGDLRLQVSNNYPEGGAVFPSDSTGMGLKNIERRLKILYHDDKKVQLIKTDKTVVVSFAFSGKIID